MLSNFCDALDKCLKQFLVVHVHILKKSSKHDYFIGVATDHIG